jgi:hypothetical protein
MEDTKLGLKHLSLALAALMSLALNACQEGGEVSGTGSSDGRIVLTMVDNPAVFDAVTIVVNSVEAHLSGADTISGWTVLNHEASSYDLLELRNGVSVALADTTLAAGHYTQLRLILGSGSTVTVDGTEYPLEIPSGMETGLKLNHQFTIEPDRSYELTLDFDAERSVKLTGSGTYQLNPVIRLQANEESGTISGTVLPAGNDAVVYTMVGSDTVWAYPETTTGYFKLMALPSGTYAVVFLNDSLSVEETITGVQVIAMQNLDLGVIFLEGN